MRSTSVAIQLALVLSAPAFGQAQDTQKDAFALTSQSAESTHITPDPEAPTLGQGSLRDILELPSWPSLEDRLPSPGSV